MVPGYAFNSFSISGKVIATLATGGNVVQIDSQFGVSHLLYHFRIKTEQALVADPFVVKRWQHQNAGATVIDCGASQLDGIGCRTGACPRHHALSWQSGLRQMIQ